MIRTVLAGLALAFVTCLAQAQAPSPFYAGHPPAVAASIPGPLTVICFDAYCLEESGSWRQPVWSAEHMLAAQIPPRGTDRKNPFHAEPRLPTDQRAELADYAACSKIDDRGHATPVGDFTAPALRDQTFSLANMMAQTKVLNEQTWNHIENGVRAAVKREGEGWIVTGPRVSPGAPTLCGRLPQPDFIWKAIYLPKSGTVGAYWAPNDQSKAFTTISLAELTARTGVDPFPGLTADQKAAVHALPAPVAGGA